MQLLGLYIEVANTYSTYYITYLSLTHSLCDIFSLHTIPYTFLPYTQCTLHTSLTCNSLSRNFLTHITTIITSIIYLF